MKKKNLIIIIGIIALIIIIVLARGKKGQEPAVENNETLPSTEETAADDQNVEIPVPPINEEDTIIDEVETDLDNVNAEDDAALDSLEDETDKLDLSGNDEDLDLETEIEE